MKRILTLAAVCLFVFQLNAQTLPQGIAYQAVAVKEGPYSLAGQNAPTIYWSNKDIQVRFTILDKYPSGTSQYSEVHATTTDGFGVFNLIIGQGDVLSGDFTKIPWELGTAHLQVEIDFDNNGSFKLTSLEKFWSVPYAFTTRKSSSTSTDSSLNALNNKYNYLRNRDKDTVIGNEGGVSYASLDSLNQVLLAKLARLESLNALDKDTVIGNELQNLILTGDSLSISDGNTVKIDFPANLDNDPVNEIQSLTIKGDSLSISDGNTVKIDFPINLDNDTTNEIQTISLINDTISLSKGGGNVSLESIKTYVSSSSTTTGKNGTVDDMWFGFNSPIVRDNVKWLDADTVYTYESGNILKIKPSGIIDTVYSNTAWIGTDVIVRPPFFYVSTSSGIKGKKGHFDSTMLSTGNFKKLGQVIDRFGNMIRRERGTTSGYGVYTPGDISFYCLKRDSSYTFKNPSRSNWNHLEPQIINDSLILIGRDIWKYSQDTLFFTQVSIPVVGGDRYGAAAAGNLLTINEENIIYDRIIVDRLGGTLSNASYLYLYSYNVRTNRSSVIHVGAVPNGTKPKSKERFYGISQNKALIWITNQYFWLDCNSLSLRRFNPTLSDPQVVTKAKFCRIAIFSGSWKNGNLRKFSYPNLNFGKPQSGTNYLHE